MTTIAEAMKLQVLRSGGPGSGPQGGRHSNFGQKVSFGGDKKEAIAHAKERRAYGESVAVYKRDGGWISHTGNQGPGATRMVDYFVAPK